ncbi:hypothetical protein [Castellaniella sp.]|uniref:hypothetical protein n=1 Tax=Castellaniella sp. TaxID=1955812 RepID=UPI00355CB7D6
MADIAAAVSPFTVGGPRRRTEPCTDETQQHTTQEPSEKYHEYTYIQYGNYINLNNTSLDFPASFDLRNAHVTGLLEGTKRHFASFEALKWTTTFFKVPTIAIMNL